MKVHYEEFEDIESKRAINRIGNEFDTEFDTVPTEEELNTLVLDEVESVIGTSTDGIDQITGEIAIIEEKKLEIEHALNTAKLKDAGYLENELKEMILASKAVLSVLQSDIKRGTQPRMYEVYATLTNTIVGQYKELRQLNESVAKLVVEFGKHDLNERKEDNKVSMHMNTVDIMDMYLSVKNEDSELDALDADFDVLTESVEPESLPEIKD